MKPRIASLTLLCLGLLVVPAYGQQDLYDNGPVNGNTDAWTINFGFVVSDSFINNSGANTFVGFAFWAWVFPGDSITSVDLEIGTAPGDSSLFPDTTIALTQVGSCLSNNFGFDVCEYEGTFSGTTLPPGAPPLWVSIQNAVVPSGDPAYWDENSGVGCMGAGCPSMGYVNTVGTIPSEAFTMEGGFCGARNNNSPDCGPPTPEPSGIMLFGSGILGIVGVLRRNLF
jgi:PEP-CTERM motif